ncbi:unknown [Prevotella sp. CAG:924]|nr:unknown [Prevotella sp. CAG:924]
MGNKERVKFSIFPFLMPVFLLFSVKITNFASYKVDITNKRQ